MHERPGGRVAARRKAVVGQRREHAVDIEVMLKACTDRPKVS
jgi:hypothetical protein